MFWMVPYFVTDSPWVRFSNLGTTRTDHALVRIVSMHSDIAIWPNNLFKVMPSTKVWGGGGYKLIFAYKSYTISN